MFELTCLILSMLIYITYISIVCFKYTVPDCISKTYYMIDNKNMFTIWMIAISFLLFPAWVSISYTNYLFITFLSVVSLSAVGLFPKYLEQQRVLHVIFTYIASALSIIWSMISGMYIILLSLLVILIPLYYIFPQYRLFAIENAAFANIYISALVKILLIV